MVSSRNFVGGTCLSVMVLTIAAIVLMDQLNKEYAGGSSYCAIAPGTSVTDWLCNFVWVTAGVTLAAIVVLTLLMCGKLWYRGGCYKFLQLLLLAVPAVAWAVAAGYVTDYGLAANKSPNSSEEEWLRYALIAVSLSAAALLLLATLVRAVVKPGKVRQGELDAMEAERRAEQAVAWMRRHYGEAAVRDYGGVKAAREDALADIQEQEYAAGMRYGGGCLSDGKTPDDDIYVPRHPRWYGQFLLPNRVDLSTARFMPGVLDQNPLSSCTAHAAANAYRFSLVKEARMPEAFMPSRMFVWYHAKQLAHPKEMQEGKHPGTQDLGANIYAAFKAVQLYGACNESLFPYGPHNLKFRPSEKCYDDARRHMLKLRPIKLLPSHSLEPLAEKIGWEEVYARYGPSRYACLMDPYEKLYTIKAALARGHPIACSLKIYMPIFEKFNVKAKSPTLRYAVLHYPEDSLFRKPDKEWGRHAVLLVGFNDTRSGGWFKFQNSWGAGWGRKGYFYTDIEYLADSRLARDFWFFNN